MTHDRAPDSYAAPPHSPPSRLLPVHRQSRRRRDQRGAALVEFALVFPLLVFILYGLISFGMILAAKQVITNAASEGARSAIGATNPAQTARNRALDALESIDGDGVAIVSVATPFCLGSSGPTCIKVTVSYPYGTNPLIPPAPGLGLITPDSISSSATVQIGA